jgi:hypothetical protein
MADNDPVEDAARNPDVYVFYTDTTDVVGPFDPERHPDYRFLANVEPCSDGWRWSAVAIVEARNLYELPGLADAALTGPSDPVDDTAKPVKHGSKVLRSPPHFPYFGFARVQVKKGSADDVLRLIDNVEGYSGSAMVSGKFLIFVEIGSDVPDEVCPRLIALAGLPDVDGVEAGRVTGEQYFYKPIGKWPVGQPEP